MVPNLNPVSGSLAIHSHSSKLTLFFFFSLFLWVFQRYKDQQAFLRITFLKVFVSVVLEPWILSTLGKPLSHTPP